MFTISYQINVTDVTFVPFESYLNKFHEFLTLNKIFSIKQGFFSDRKPTWWSKSPSKYLRKLNNNPKGKYMFRITNKILD